MGNTAIALSDQVVNEIFRGCLHQHGDNPLTTTPVQHITHEVARFNQPRLDNHRQEIHQLVSQLSNNFRKDGGASYFYSQLDREGHRWTRFEPIQERLVQLGFAIGEIEFVHERRYWPALYQGRPLLYITQR